jgi:hypothetical protein
MDGGSWIAWIGTVTATTDLRGAAPQVSSSFKSNPSGDSVLSSPHYAARQYRGRSAVIRGGDPGSIEYLMFKVFNNERPKLPTTGDLAEHTPGAQVNAVNAKRKVPLPRKQRSENPRTMEEDSIRLLTVRGHSWAFRTHSSHYSADISGICGCYKRPLCRTRRCPAIRHRRLSS